MEIVILIKDGKYFVSEEASHRSMTETYRILSKKYPNGVFVFEKENMTSVKQLSEAVLVFNVKSRFLTSDVREFCKILGYASENGIEDFKNDYADTSNGYNSIGMVVNNEVLQSLDLEGLNKFENVQVFQGENVPNIYIPIDIDHYLNRGELSEIYDSLLPSEIDGYVLTKDIQMALLQMHSAFLTKIPVHGYSFVGSAGSGKTKAVLEIIPKYLRSFGYEFDYLFLNPTTIDEPEKLFGIKDIITTEDGMQTVYSESILTQELRKETDVPLVVAINEYNRPTDAAFFNALIPLFGEEKTVSIGLETFPVKRPLLFLLTSNEGINFSSAMLVDAALKSRISVIRMTTPDISIWKAAAEKYNRLLRDVLLNGLVEEGWFTTHKKEWTEFESKFTTILVKILFEMSKACTDADASINISIRQMQKILEIILNIIIVLNEMPSDDVIYNVIRQHTVNTLDSDETPLESTLNSILEKHLGR